MRRRRSENVERVKTFALSVAGGAIEVHPLT